MTFEASYTTLRIHLFESRFLTVSSFLIAIQDVLIYGILIGLFTLTLTILFRYSKWKMEKPNFVLKEQEFYKKYGYSYEFVFVFPVLAQDQIHQLTSYQKKYTMKHIIDRLQNAGLETSLFYSCQRDEIYVKVRATHERLLKEAYKIGYKLLLDPTRIRTKLSAGKRLNYDVENDDIDDSLQNDGYKWKPVVIEDDFGIVPYKPFDYIYGPYVEREELQSLYVKRPTSKNKNIILSEVDRIKLMIEIMSGDISATPPGAGISLVELKVNEVILAAFPIHNYDTLEELQKEWLKFSMWRQPLDRIKSYFGERIGLYFTLMDFYQNNLLLPAILGLVTFAVQILQQTHQSTLQPYYTIYMLIWNSMFIEEWECEQSRRQLYWGIDDFESEEKPRPQYVGEKIKSPVHNKEILHFHPSLRTNRQVIVLFIMLFMIMIALGLIAGCFVLEEYLYGINASVKSTINIKGFYGVNFVNAIIQSLLILINDSIVERLIIPLNNYENYRTQTDYEDALVAKFFFFKIFNDYGALVYLGFIKKFLSNQGCEFNDCIFDLAETLRVMFLLHWIIRFCNQIFVRLYLQSAKEKSESAGLEPGKKASAIEKQYILSEYDVLLDTIRDYGGMVTTYGYMILFVAAYPIGPFLSLVATYLQVRIDGWKFCQSSRRPIPQINQDIGVWQDALTVLSFFAVLSNLGLLAFIMDYFVDYKWQTRWVLFIIGEHLLIFYKAITKLFSDDIPEAVQYQIDRKDFITRKVVNDEPDEIDPPYERPDHFVPIHVSDTDNGWIYPGEEDEEVINAIELQDESKQPEVEMKNIYPKSDNVTSEKK